MPRITSLQNARIKQVRQLRQRKAREQAGTFLLEGRQAILEAIHLRWQIECFVVAPELFHAGQQDILWHAIEAHQRFGVGYLEVTAEIFEALATKETAHGILAVVHQRWEQLAQIRPAQNDCWVVLETVQYPGNLGTILRTADAVGTTGIILIGQTTDPYDPAAVRASAGAICSQRLIRTSPEAFGRWARQHRINLVGTSPAAPTDYRSAAYPRPLALLMGGERYGLSSNLMSICGQTIRIPMAGRSDSLNLAVATGVILYEIYREGRWTKDEGR
jgi:TrmH family RNA methyltransferase